jgi:hypothetical protein
MISMRIPRESIHRNHRRHRNHQTPPVTQKSYRSLPGHSILPFARPDPSATGTQDFKDFKTGETLESSRILGYFDQDFKHFKDFTQGGLPRGALRLASTANNPH